MRICVNVTLDGVPSGKRIFVNEDFNNNVYHVQSRSCFLHLHFLLLRNNYT